MTGTAIAQVTGRQILDSRGRPTVEVDVVLRDGSFGRAAAPSGASTGRHEAWELRDRDPACYRGLGVSGAVQNVRTLIARGICGLDAQDQAAVDAAMVALDGSPRLDTLGANAVLATSLAVAHAAAISAGVPLHRHIHALLGVPGRPMTMPMPMTNILSGGAHAGRSMDVQDFLVMPIGARSYAEALHMICEVRQTAAALMAESGLSTLLADEGGLSPGFADVEAALELMVRSFEAAGLRPGHDVAIALDVAASELHEGGTYTLARAGRSLSADGMVDLFDTLTDRYPVVSIEDALDQDDWSGWRTATRTLSRIQLVGDDLFVTNPDRIRRGIDEQVGNAVLIKLNQNGTLSGTLDAIRTAWSGGMACVVSARSGETEDSTIADLAVGSGAGQIKIGSVRSSERLAKYNQLSRIEQDGELAFAGMTAPTRVGARVPEPALQASHRSAS